MPGEFIDDDSRTPAQRKADILAQAEKLEAWAAEPEARESGLIGSYLAQAKAAREEAEKIQPGKAELQALLEAAWTRMRRDAANLERVLEDPRADHEEREATREIYRVSRLAHRLIERAIHAEKRAAKEQP